MPPDPDLARYALASFAHLLDRGERLSPSTFAARIGAHYDAGNPRTAAAIAAIQALPGDLVLVGGRQGAYVRGRHAGNSAHIALEVRDG